MCATVAPRVHRTPAENPDNLDRLRELLERLYEALWNLADAGELDWHDVAGIEPALDLARDLARERAA